jgi:hypothetical protein
MSKNSPQALRRALQRHELYKTVDLADLIGEALEACHESPGLDEPEYLAGMALELATLHTEVNAALELLKAKLREVARDELPEHPAQQAGVPITIEGEDYENNSLGTVVVTFPSKVIKLRKGTDTARLKRSLGPAFPDYFEEQTTYTPVDDFEAKTLNPLLVDAPKSLDPTKAAEARLALSAVEVTMRPTPRVSFKYDPHTHEE